MSEALHFAEHRLQEVALVWMGLVYVVRLFWLFRWKAGRDRQPRTGHRRDPKALGVLYSWALIGMPWEMESIRTKLFLYAQFVVFHLGVAVAIGLSFVIPYAPGLLAGRPWLVTAVQVMTGAACAVGVLRIVRRAGGRYMRAISSPDDYFSLVLLTVWFAFATLAVPNDVSSGEGVLLGYFWMTAFFLVYVPFSKISHYLYYPFTRFWFGRTMAHRGVYPMTRGVK
ncbi:MAG: hypothetical protein HY744_14350 [Deltaproteobacteria bacterium]|nr:hypothetical protein [Deltaproteobacteria bacterium]